MLAINQTGNIVVNMNNTPFKSASEAAKHFRLRLKFCGISAIVRAHSQFGGFVKIQPKGGCDVTFSDDEQSQLLSMLSVNNLASAGYQPITGDSVRAYGAEGYLQTN